MNHGRLTLGSSLESKLNPFVSSYSMPSVYSGLSSKQIRNHSLANSELESDLITLPNLTSVDTTFEKENESKKVYLEYDCVPSPPCIEVHTPTLPEIDIADNLLLENDLDTTVNSDSNDVTARCEPALSDSSVTHNTNCSISLALNPLAKPFTPRMNKYDINAYANGDLQLCLTMPPYFVLFCYIFSVYLYSCICTPIGSSHDDVNIDTNKLCCNEEALQEKTSRLSIDDDSDPYKLLKRLKISNVNRLIIGQLNINSLRNKIEALKLIMMYNIDILIITETKLDETFPKSQFYIDGYAPPFRVDRSKNGGESSSMLEKTYLLRNFLNIHHL